MALSTINQNPIICEDAINQINVVYLDHTVGQGQVKAFIGMMNVCDSFRTIRTMHRSVVQFA